MFVYSWLPCLLRKVKWHVQIRNDSETEDEIHMHIASVMMFDIIHASDETAEEECLENRDPDVIPDLYSFEEEEERQYGCEISEESKKKKRNNGPARVKRTNKEENELRQLLPENFSDLKCPNTKQIQKAVRKSMKTGGIIHVRPMENIKIKVSNMLIKIRNK